MANIDAKNIAQAIEQVNYNPTEITRILLQSIYAASNGVYTAFSATSPFITTIEAAAVTSGSIMEEIRAITRAHYAPTVDNWLDLYKHMQDPDYLEMSAQPGQASINFFLSVEEVKRKAIAGDVADDRRYLEFPRHTQIKVGDLDLVIKFPFMVTVNRNGAINIKYRLDTGNVLGRVRNALINHSHVRINDVDGILFPIEVVQCALASSNHTVTESSGFRKRIKLDGLFHKLKAYVSINDKWVEIDTTRRLSVLNKNKTTLQYEVDNDSMLVTIPSYYVSNGMVGDEVRLDIYTTQGELTQPLGQYNDTGYAFKYYDYNNPSNKYQGILGGLSILQVYSDDTVSGGRNPIPFDVMKKRVVNRSTLTEGVPITALELEYKLGDKGLSSTKTLDNVTDRIYAASRLLPPPSNDLTVTGVGCNVRTHHTAISDLARLKTVRGNGDQLTILPSTLYKEANGIFSVVDADLVAQMTDPNRTAPESAAVWANSNRFMFSPYFYVHDIKDSRYSTRAYRLDKPEVLSKYSINENYTLGLDASIYNYQMQVLPEYSGFRLLVGLIVGDSFKDIPIEDISLQMSYVDQTGNNRYHIQGHLESLIDSATGRPMGDNYVYRFDFNTDWKIDREHNLIMSDTGVPIPLVGDMDVFIVIRGYRPTTYVATEMDKLINLYTLPNYDGNSSQSVLAQERLNIQFGRYMKHLWNRSLTVIGEEDYLRYSEDVPMKYTADVFKLDANGNVETTVVDGKIVAVFAHRKGDQVYDEVGRPIMVHRIGDIVHVNGMPQYIDGPRGLRRQWDIVVMDGLYYLTTHQPTIDYVMSTLDFVDTIVFDTLANDIRPELIQRTSIQYHPKSTVGPIKLLADNGSEVTLDSDQELQILFRVSPAVYSNLDLRRNLELQAKQTIQRVLETNSTISLDSIVTSVKADLGENILGVVINGFMNDQYTTVSVLDDLTTPSIGKRLYVNSKLELVIMDSVTFEFIPHYPKVALNQ